MIMQQEPIKVTWVFDGETHTKSFDTIQDLDRRINYLFHKNAAENEERRILLEAVMRYYRSMEP